MSNPYVDKLQNGELNDSVHMHFTTIGSSSGSTSQNIKFDVLSDSTPRNSESVNLSMGNLVSNPVVDPNADNTANAVFSGLIYTDPRTIGKEFTVAEVPVGQERSMLPKLEIHPIKSSNPQQNMFGNRRLSNWFSRLLDQRGQDYISSGRLTADEVGKNAERILDDMMNGKIDYNQYGQYVILPAVIETLINYCSNKIAINQAIHFSLGYTYNDYLNKEYIQDPARFNTVASIADSMFRNMTQAITIVNQDLAIYNILYNKLTYVNATKNASALFSLPNELKNYNRQMKKRY